MTQSIETTITSLGGLGDGVATHNGKPLFVPKSCAGDRLEVAITRENKDAVFGEIVEVISAGTDRQSAACKHFSQCGGCSLQHLRPESYRAFKTGMLKESLARAGFTVDAEVVFLDAPTRRRVDFKVEGGALAFHAMRSHALVPVVECPVLTPALQALMAPLAQALAGLPFGKDIVGASLTQADEGIDVLLTTRHVPKLPPMEAFCKTLGLARVAVQSGNTKPRVAGQIAPVHMRLGASRIDLSPNAFLQATEAGQGRLTETALAAAQSAKKVVDLFAGIGTYSFPLAAHTRVHAVEGEVDMVRAIKTNAAKLGMQSLTAECRDLFKQPFTAQELRGFDAAIINPPRTGAKAQTEQLVQSDVSTVVMISCNPATFGRDANTLKDGGFSLVSAYGLDQFVWSTHLEIAAVFKR